MSLPNHSDHRIQGDVILARLAETGVPAALKKPAAEFKKIHGALVVATKAAEAARVKRDDAMRTIAAADDALDTSVNALADMMVGAQMGTRKNAFATYSKHAPGALTGLAYAVEVKEVRALTAKLKKAKPSTGSPAVAKAALACEKLAAAVDLAIKALTSPQLALHAAMAARDALLLDWMKALVKLKRKALGEWFDDDAKYEAVFAAPSAVQAPTRAVKTKAKAAPVPVTPVVAAATATS